MLPAHVAIVSESGQTNPSQMAQIAQALQTQVLRDLGPLWGVQATVAYFPALADIPVGAWPVIVKDNIGNPEALGFHTDSNNQPYALVQFNETLSLTVSHELQEMLVDPQGNRTHAGASPQDGNSQVQFLVEACDPCEDPSCAYSIEGVLVSDFITPNFYDPVASPGTRYSFTGAIPEPRQIVKGGYISFLDPATGDWWQQIWQGANPEFRNLGRPSEEGQGEGGAGEEGPGGEGPGEESQSLREWIDRQTPVPALQTGASSAIATVAHAQERASHIVPTREARANILKAVIEAL
jgi:hypothetical protein